MSGGSYNYLYSTLDVEDLINKQQDLEQMANRLTGLPEAEFRGAEAAAAITRELILMLKIWESAAGAYVGMMADVWKSVEWWDSNDSGPDSVKQALKALVEGKPPTS